MECTGRSVQLKGKRFVSLPQRTPVIKRIRPAIEPNPSPLFLSLSLTLFLLPYSGSLLPLSPSTGLISSFPANAAPPTCLLPLLCSPSRHHSFRTSSLAPSSPFFPDVWLASRKLDARAWKLAERHANILFHPPWRATRAETFPPLPVPGNSRDVFTRPGAQADPIEIVPSNYRANTTPSTTVLHPYQTPYPRAIPSDQWRERKNHYPGPRTFSGGGCSYCGANGRFAIKVLRSISIYRVTELFCLFLIR